MSSLFSVLITAPEPTSALLLAIERGLVQVALFSKLIVEGIAVGIIILSIAAALPKLFRRRLQLRQGSSENSIRLKLGLSLSLALEFLLAADILGTAVSPSWDAIAKLGAIAGIRTFLNFFLHQELKGLEKQTQLENATLKD